MDESGTELSKNFTEIEGADTTAEAVSDQAGYSGGITSLVGIHQNLVAAFVRPALQRAEARDQAVVQERGLGP